MLESNRKQVNDTMLKKKRILPLILFQFNKRLDCITWNERFFCVLSNSACLFRHAHPIHTHYTLQQQQQKLYKDNNNNNGGMKKKCFMHQILLFTLKHIHCEKNWN